MKKSIKDFIQEDVGQTVVVSGTVTHELKETKDKDKNYLKVSISDGTGRVHFIAYKDDRFTDMIMKMAQGTEVIVSGTLKTVKTTQKTINEFSRIDSLLTTDMSVVVDDEKIREELRGYLKELKTTSPTHAAIANACLKEAPEFLNAPYGPNIYAYNSGLADFTLRLLKKIQKHKESKPSYIVFSGNDVDYDTLSCAALIYRCGASLIHRMEKGRVVTSTEGQLNGEGLVTLSVVLKVIHRSKLTDAQKTMLKHVIASCRSYGEGANLATARTYEANLLKAFEAEVIADGYAEKAAMIQSLSLVPDEMVTINGRNYFVAYKE